MSGPCTSASRAPTSTCGSPSSASAASRPASRPRPPSTRNGSRNEVRVSALRGEDGAGPAWRGAVPSAVGWVAPAPTSAWPVRGRVSSARGLASAARGCASPGWLATGLLARAGASLIVGRRRGDAQQAGAGLGERLEADAVRAHAVTAEDLLGHAEVAGAHDFGMLAGQLEHRAPAQALGVAAVGLLGGAAVEARAVKHLPEPPDRVLQVLRGSCHLAPGSDS